jgi:RNA polymerase sigma-70 factor (ECF subfamily)
VFQVTKDHDHPVLVLAEAAAPSVNRFEALFERFYPELYALVYRVLGERMATEDTLQDAFFQLSKDQHLQDKPEAEVGAWLRRVALNLSFNRIRGDKRAQQRLERVGRLESTEHPEPADVAIRLEEQAAVRQALANLPDKQRECLLLRHSGYSYQEIAATVGVAIGSVGVLLARAEQAFRATYGRHSQA